MDDPPTANPYKTLNVPKDATLATIRSAHRKLVLSCHPDKVQDPTVKQIKAEQFHQVQQAYEILSDDKRRRHYDDKVKLDELKAEMAYERGPPLSRRATEFEYVPRNGPSKREMRDNTVYETREPRYTRYSDEDYFAPRHEPRAPTKSYDDYYHASSSRRSSGRASEDKRKNRAMEDEKERRRRERDEEEYERQRRSKQRDKEKREKHEMKSKSRNPRYDSGSDSEVEDNYRSRRREPVSKSRVEDLPMRQRGEFRKHSKSEVGMDEELQQKIYAHNEYISSKREPIAETESRRSGRTRGLSDLDSRMEPRTPPGPDLEAGNRSSGKRGYSNKYDSPVSSSKKDKYAPQIVEASADRKPSLSGVKSDSKTAKNGFWSSPSRKEPQRSATYNQPKEFKPAPIRRSGTAPVDRVRNGASKPSNLANMVNPSDSSDLSDSGSESPEEIIKLPSRPSLASRQKKTSYVVREPDIVEPEDPYPPRPREKSPKTPRSAARPSMTTRGASMQTPQVQRTSSYAFPQEERSPRPEMLRRESSKPTPTKSHQSPRLFGEQFSIPEDEYGSRRSPNMYPEDRYTKSYSRRGSEEVGPDEYPSSRSHHRHPGLQRAGTAVY